MQEADFLLSPRTPNFVADKIYVEVIQLRLSGGETGLV